MKSILNRIQNQLNSIQFGSANLTSKRGPGGLKKWDIKQNSGQNKNLLKSLLDEKQDKIQQEKKQEKNHLENNMQKQNRTGQNLNLLNGLDVTGQNNQPPVLQEEADKKLNFPSWGGSNPAHKVLYFDDNIKGSKRKYVGGVDSQTGTTKTVQGNPIHIPDQKPTGLKKWDLLQKQNSEQSQLNAEKNLLKRQDFNQPSQEEADKQLNFPPRKPQGDPPQILYFDKECTKIKYFGGVDSQGRREGEGKEYFSIFF